MGLTGGHTVPHSLNFIPVASWEKKRNSLSLHGIVVNPGGQVLSKNEPFIIKERRMECSVYYYSE